MTINYTWIINKVDCKTSVGNMADYVVNIHWSLLGTDSNSSYSNSIQGLTSFVEKSDDTDYILFENLTQDIVINWVKNNIENDLLQNYKSIIANQIHDQISPPFINPKLPWAL